MAKFVQYNPAIQKTSQSITISRILDSRSFIIVQIAGSKPNFHWNVWNAAKSFKYLMIKQFVIILRLTISLKIKCSWYFSIWFIICKIIEKWINMNKMHVAFIIFHSINCYLHHLCMINLVQNQNIYKSNYLNVILSLWLRCLHSISVCTVISSVTVQTAHSSLTFSISSSIHCILRYYFAWYTDRQL